MQGEEKERTEVWTIYIYRLKISRGVFHPRVMTGASRTEHWKLVESVLWALGGMWERLPFCFCTLSFISFQTTFFNHMNVTFIRKTKSYISFHMGFNTPFYKPPFHPTSFLTNQFSDFLCMCQTWCLTHKVFC